MAKAVPIADSYWVSDNALLAGEYPGAKAESEAIEKLTRIRAAGVTCLIDLTMEGELNPYQHALAALEASDSRMVDYHRKSIPDQSVPTQSEMVDILDLIDRSIESGHIVYVHCWGGIGRTGTVVGCYLARHEYAAGNAVLDRIAEMRRNTPDGNRRSPETWEQIAMVTSWRAGD